MKRTMSVTLVLVMLLGLCACGTKTAPESQTPTWQEQYDLGVKYLSEGNYEEAVIAFELAIEIDDKKSEAYAGLADVYAAQGDTQRLQAILEQGVNATGDVSLTERLAELTAEPEPEMPALSDSPEEMPEIPEILQDSYLCGVSAKGGYDFYAYLPINETVAELVAPLIDAGLAGNQKEALALVQSDEMWNAIGEEMRDAILAGTTNSEVPDDSDWRSGGGVLAFWTMWDGALLHLTCDYEDGELHYTVEYRPESGTSFQVSHAEYSVLILDDFTTGPVSGYLMNGAFTMDSVTSNSDTGEVNTYHNEGSAVDELLDGPYTRIVESTLRESRTTYEYQFENGEILFCWADEDGEACCEKVTLKDGTVDYRTFFTEREPRELIRTVSLGPGLG